MSTYTVYQHASRIYPYDITYFFQKHVYVYRNKIIDKNVDQSPKSNVVASNVKMSITCKQIEIYHISFRKSQKGSNPFPRN